MFLWILNNNYSVLRPVTNRYRLTNSWTEFVKNCNNQFSATQNQQSMSCQKSVQGKEAGEEVYTPG